MKNFTTKLFSQAGLLLFSLTGLSQVAPEADMWISVSPNPFRNATSFSIKDGYRDGVSVTIYDRMGKLIRVLNTTEDRQNAGNLVWDGTSGNGQPMPQGIYLYQAKSNGMTANGKIILL